MSIHLNFSWKFLLSFVLLRIAHHLEEEKEGLRAEDVWVQKGLVIGGFRGGVGVIYG